MAILVDTETRLVVQGLTGSEGRFHGLRNRGYGTNLVAGVTPGKGGQDVEGVPVLDTVAEAVAGARGEHGDGLRARRRSPPTPSTRRSTPACTPSSWITEGVPAHEMLRIHAYIRANGVPHARPELSRRALAGEGERRDHPGRDLHARRTSASCRAPERSRTRSATS